MKKLISVFAALALVGSLAAQKGKKAPAKPAAPVVAAPKAPAMPAAVTAAPAAAGAAKGVGLFIEARGGYILSAGTSTAKQDGNTTGTTSTYKLSNTDGFGGGATIGYDLINNLALAASFDYRTAKSIEWSTTGAATTQKTTNKFNTMVVGVGLRPRVQAGPGAFYAGLGVAIVLPHDDISNVTTTVIATSAVTTTEVTTRYNLGIGAYGELGYNFNITDNLYIGLGARIVVAGKGLDNKGNDTTTVTTNAAGTTTTTVKNTDSVDTTATPSQTAFASKGITDMSGVITVGFRF